MPQAPKLDVRVISDTICPFCWLGTKKLEAAIKLAESQGLISEANIKLEPFQLDPSLPEQYSMSKRDRYLARWGGPDAVARKEKDMQERFKPYGVDFTYDGQVRQTTQSHRLLEKAYQLGGQKLQFALWEPLARGYFSEAKDIGDEAFLIESALAAGVFSNAEEVKTFLESDEGVDEYRAGILTAQRLGVHGVPFIILNDKYAIPGAVEPEQMLEVIQKTVS